MVIETICSMYTQYGFIEIKRLSDNWWALYVDGEIKQQSPNYDYIYREYEKLR